MTSPLSPEAVAQMVADLTTKAAMINMGEKIAWGSDSGVMDAAADMLTTLAAENATLRAEFELLTAVKDAHKMRGDNHWETLRSIRVLAQEGKLDHIIQHVSDAGAGYTQPDEVTMWGLQSALAAANDRIATLRASEAAALARAEKAETERDAYEASAVEAHRIKREHQSDALLWQYSAAAGNVPPLLMKIWKQRKAEMERAKRLEDALQEGRRAIGDHYAPHDCYATGPLTGDTFRDLVQCPACSFIAMHDAALAPFARKGE